MRKKTQEEFEQELHNINTNIIVMGKYINFKTKIKLKCKIDGYEWEQTPNNLLTKKTGCPKCSGRAKKTDKEFIEEIKGKSPNIKIVGEYIGANNKIDCECLICGHKWKPFASALSRGAGCPHCANLNHRTNSKDFKAKLIKKFKNLTYDILTDFITYQHTLKCKCTKCNYEWYANPKSLMSGTACPKCGGTKQKTHEEFLKEINDIVGDEYTVIGKYIKINKKIKIKHNTCGNVFEMTPNNFFNGQRCTFCNQSKGEVRIKNYLDNYNLHYIPQKTFKGLIGTRYGLLSYDFYLPTYNLLIEYQGEFHDGTAKLQNKSKLKRQQEHDKRKKQYAINNNIQLLEIWYYDFENIENILNKMFIKR